MTIFTWTKLQVPATKKPLAQVAFGHALVISGYVVVSFESLASVRNGPSKSFGQAMSVPLDAWPEHSKSV